MNVDKNITGIILAGGKSSRMGSDKGLLFLDNKPFLQHIIDALTPLVQEIILVSNNPDHDVFKVKRVQDIIPESGPISGIHTGLTHSKTENNLVLSCDVPLITTPLLKKLLLHEKEDYDIIQFEAERKTIPLIALYKKQCLSKCFELLSSNEKRLRKLVLALNAKTIPVSQDEYTLVKNINTIEDLNTITNAIDY
ncbi:molybdenum cofactor guanylyltransferase [Aquimarina mytili]|uniref:Probable molybdenum cofactor guanylyltransferase n=1 Tax=Aquimarina mytili TaxID=874423 RepID=A0A937D928_9FLAO|nr:molybdenum cofactor guanylyltransferase [Aquimarina mytili]MBL0682093.1 molybdenum cofactor guanylyltransferase [Aquimarina mytili]